MRQPIIAVIVCVIGIAAVSSVVERWPDGAGGESGVDHPSAVDHRGPIARDEPSAPAPPRRLSLPSPQLSEAQPVTAASPAVVDALGERRGAPAERVLWGYQTEVCACESTECITELADRHPDLLTSLPDFDRRKVEQKALLEGIRKCIELAWAREQPIDLRTPVERAAERERERRRIMLGEHSSSAGAVGR